MYLMPLLLLQVHMYLASPRSCLNSCLASRNCELHRESAATSATGVQTSADRLGPSACCSSQLRDKIMKAVVSTASHQGDHSRGLTIPTASESIPRATRPASRLLHLATATTAHHEYLSNLWYNNAKSTGKMRIGAHEIQATCRIWPRSSYCWRR